jgi:Uma2 family endonuclease
MAVAALVPIEEYLSTSWDPDREYLAGRLIERNVGELDHSYLQSLLLKLLDRRGLLAFVELRVQVRADRFRIPDVLAVRQMPSGRFLRRPPYIVVEVLSPDDRSRDLDDKIDDYLAFGVENIWVIDPGRFRLTVWTRDGGRICRDAVETSDGEFSIPLSEIFADMPSTEDQ